MGGDFEQRASRRGAAGGDVRMSDVPQEYVEACLERLSEESVEGEPKTPLLRILERAIRRDQLVLPMVSTTLTRVLGLLERPDVDTAQVRHEHHRRAGAPPEPSSWAAGQSGPPA